MAETTVLAFHTAAQSTHPGQFKRLTKVDIVASIALAGHGIWNRQAFTGNFVVQYDVNAAIAEIQFGPFFNSDNKYDQMWRPWEMPDSNFKQLGLDSQGQPISDQICSTFQGRLGISQATTLLGASYLDGSDLNTNDWVKTDGIFQIGDALNKIPSQYKSADGPGGPGSRDWVTNAVPIVSP
jgi:hypothetical protein